MVLTLPSFTLAVERNIAVQLHPRHINTKQLFPCVVALSGGHIRLFKYDMLEVIDHSTIRNKGESTGKMAVTELAGILPEEAHGHAINSIDME